jgi:hypothetical protein
MGYNYTIEYKKGKDNKAVDALSRKPNTESMRAISTVVPLWVNDVQTSYTGDSKCKELEEQLHIQADSVTHFSMTNGMIRYKGKLYIGGTADLRHSLIASFHCSALGGHTGDRVTYTNSSHYFHWPGMKGEVTNFVKNCQYVRKTKLHMFHILAYYNPYQFLTWLGSTLQWILLKLCPDLKAKIPS